jgi:hypothetical protein
MFIRMNKTFKYEDEAGTKITVPRGWVGDLPDDIAQEAIDGGYGVDGNERSASPTPKPESKGRGAESGDQKQGRQKKGGQVKEPDFTAILAGTDGTWKVTKGDEDVVTGLTADEGEAFNKMSAADKAGFVEKKKTA